MIYHITASEWPRALVLPLRMPCSVQTNMALGARQAGRRRPGSVVHLDSRASYSANYATQGALVSQTPPPIDAKIIW
ncbi:hypothetical protein LA080_015792 [Diaporthe eres]|nr:hypothetical protein LA080_015792 [Diaporthe eres]